MALERSRISRHVDASCEPEKWRKIRICKSSELREEDLVYSLTVAPRKLEHWAVAWARRGPCEVVKAWDGNELLVCFHEDSSGQGLDPKASRGILHD